MNKTATVLLAALILLLGGSYFIRSTSEKKVFVANTFQNVISSVTVPRNWATWNADLRQAWLKDSSTCSFQQDTTAQRYIIAVPGKKISVTALNYLLYQVQDEDELFTFSVIPYVGNGQPRSQHNTTIVYTQQTRLLYKWLPFLERSSFADKTLSDLISYLQDSKRFYGYSIDMIQDSNTLFLTKKQVVAQQDILPAVAALFSDIENVASRNDCKPGFKNISFNNAGHDSTEILVGLNINKVIDGNGFMQLPPGQILLTGHYEGPFKNRNNVYGAMERYLLDHELVKRGAGFERYFSSVPVSDSSEVRFDLCYPLRY